MVLNRAAIARISTSLQKAETILEYYHDWTEFDDQIEKVYDVVQKLASTLRVIRIALLQSWHQFDPNTTLDSLWSSRRVTAPLLAQLAILKSTVTSQDSKRPSLIPRAFHNRNVLILSYRTRMRKRLYESVSEIQNFTVDFAKDLDLIIYDIQRSLLEHHIEQYSLNEESFSLVKPPPLKENSSSETCADCKTIFDLRDFWPIELGTNPFQPTLSFNTSILKIFDSAWSGCHFCRLQLTRLLEQGATVRHIAYVHITWWKYWHKESNYTNTNNDILFSKDLRIRYLSDDMEIVHFDYYITLPLIEADQNRRIGLLTASRSTLAIVRAWLSNCSSTHDRCKRDDSAILSRPKRLIHLGEFEKLEPRLVEVGDIPPDVVYMTLSHRWSYKATTQLLRSNITQFYQNIPESSLPRCYLDAMKFMRRLGVSYVWIDSLCILQDSGKDWYSESAKIADIFAGSWCNIATVSSLDDTHTLHPDRSSEDVRGCIIENPPTSKFSVRAHDEGYRRWNSSITNSVLSKRGWVLQELLSAPRTLYFGKDEVMWQCKTQKSSESMPKEVDVTSRRYKSTFDDPAFSEISLYGPRGWGEIVQDYSKRELTFPTHDKLIAIGGIAKKYGNEEDYLAGLWKHDIIFQLTWRVLQKDTDAQSLEDFQAPSWTWASLNKEITYSSRIIDKMHMHRPIAKLISSNLTHVSDNKLGRLSQGTLDIQAPIIKIEFHRISRSSYTVRYHKGRNFVLPNHSSPSASRSICLDFETAFRPAAIDDDDDTITPTFLIPLYIDVERNTARPVKVHALIVECTGNAREFRRKGVMTLEGRWQVEDLANCCKSYMGVAEEDMFDGLVGEEDGWVVYNLALV
ncbi:hypothetical protein GLAREA_01793 [Glarea lozoyensis ATCC 20868]|uniref:Heterokaryon incompatibility domain-containing protein n=1 Tax=Glarea lozoyensis (strain ATCC 20868 / MF5171) TaxID=1116229 RepID=S3D1I3_GLAL2|nr:uncharacterized protein GLAREA_01793 [Glarea lozoyensis ATCC 20868]EPE25881.1 hypothetical protein GLAREA_01793 [Glarea lozoyensis ATCC 20868]